MKKIFFSGDTLKENERKKYENKGYKIDAYDANLKNNEIIQILNKEKYDGYILGGDEILDRETVLKFPDSIKVISFFGVGYEAYIDTTATNEKNICVTNTPDTNTKAVAEHTLALMLASTRNIIFDNNNTKNGKWAKERINDLEGATIGIIGMGKIGTKVAKILKYSFNANLIYYSRTRKDDLEKELEMTFVSLDELYKRSDIISIHCSLNNETKNMINQEAMSKMKKGVIIINTSRANIIEPTALFNSLENNTIRTVAFDAFYKEPIDLKSDNDFNQFQKFGDNRLIITPHTAYFSNQALKSMEDLAIKNAIDVLETGKCENTVKEIENYTENIAIYKNIMLKNYTFLIVEEQRYLDIIVNNMKKAFGDINIIATTSLKDLLSNEKIKDNNKKILMIYSNLLGKCETSVTKKIEQIKNLKAISLGNTYLKLIDLEYCKKNNIVVTTLSDYRAELRADLIIYIMQSLQGRISEYIKNLKENRIEIFPSFSLVNKKVGIIGLTEIGNAIADKCKHIGMEVSYFSEKRRNPKYKFNDLKSLVKKSDFIITAGYPKEEQYYLQDDIINEINSNAFIISSEQGNSNINENTFKKLIEDGKICGYGFTSSNDSIENYNGNVFILRDQTWDSEEVYYKLAKEWINSINLILTNKAKNLAV